MTDEEAIYLLRKTTCAECRYLLKCTRDEKSWCFLAGEMGAEALALMPEYKRLKEKDTPKKPIHNHHCPNCEWSQPVPLLDDEWCSECYYPEYCTHCGQHLDWSEEKENYEKRRNKK